MESIPLIMSEDIIKILLAKSLSIIEKNCTGNKIRRKDVHMILNRNIHLDKDLSKRIIKELVERGEITNGNREIVINKKRRII